MTQCSARYNNTLKAEFGRKISSQEANEQFIAIEAAMTCLQSLADDTTTENTIHIYENIDGTTVLDPAFGNMQLITIEGTVEISFAEPQATDPKVIYLLIADGGDGLFKLPDGTSWTSLSQGIAVTGKPYNSEGLGGDYGAVVICIHDGTGWLHICFARNDIDFDAATMDIADVYGWR
jgi:hypothetical protein